MPKLTEREKEALKEYLPQINLRPASTEKALFVLFKPGVYAHLPLELPDRLGSLNIPISFFYGDRDWM